MFEPGMLGYVTGFTASDKSRFMSQLSLMANSQATVRAKATLHLFQLSGTFDAHPALIATHFECGSEIDIKGNC